MLAEGFQSTRDPLAPAAKSITTSARDRRQEISLNVRLMYLHLALSHEAGVFEVTYDHWRVLMRSGAI
jgi:hypothetical protein